MATQVLGGLEPFATPSSWHLTGRGRTALAVLLVVLGALTVHSASDGAALAGSGVTQASAATDATPALAVPVSAEVYTVSTGDTLWAIAVSIDPAADPRPFVHEIKRLNGLSDSALSVGQRLLIPAAHAPATR